MDPVKGIAYIPEFKFDYPNKIKLTQNIYLLPSESKAAVSFRQEIESRGYKLQDGAYLYFEGDIKGDATLYEVFQGYSLALIFFNPKGRATCRAVKNLIKNEVELFIDEHDKFGYEIDDIISFRKDKISEVKSIYSRVEAQLENKDFNALRNALEFFILFLSEKQIRTRLLYLSICLESVLLESASEGLSYKLGIRCANFLNTLYRGVNMESVFNEMKNAYTLRSKIIHGDDYKDASDKIIRKKGGSASELSHVLALETVVKDVLSVIFSKQDLYDLSIVGNLGKMIDQKYILDS